MGVFDVMRDENGKPELDKRGKEQVTYYYTHSKIRDAFLTPGPVEWAGGFVPKRQVLNFSCGDIHLLVVARNPASSETQVFSAGNSAYGQLGHGETKEVHELTPIEALNNKLISKVAAGNFHSLALSMTGKTLFAWGKIDAGSLGLYGEKKTLSYEQTDYVATPQEVVFPTTFGKSCLVDIAAGTCQSSFALIMFLFVVRTSFEHLKIKICT
jgi:alpha-tubulin suppressor-like RCC1 family protein